MSIRMTKPGFIVPLNQNYLGRCLPKIYPSTIDLVQFERCLCRTQLSAKHQLWCVDECKINGTTGASTCNTLYGPDDCSLVPGKTVSGKTCTSSCHLNNEEGHYYCYTDEDEDEWEHCGFHDVPEEKKDVLEFTIDDVVCADYCGTEKRGGDKDTCTVVEWEVFKGEVNNTA